MKKFLVGLALGAGMVFALKVTGRYLCKKFGEKIFDNLEDLLDL